MKPATDPRQLAMDGLFGLPAPPLLAPGSLQMAAEVCGTLTEAIKATDLSRAHVAARMSDLTGDAISEAMINAWTAKSYDRHRFPFEYAAAFEAACETTALQSLFAAKRGSVVLVGREALDAALGRLNRQEAELRRQKRLLTQLARSGR